MRVVGIQKNRLPGFISDPLYERCDQANANEIPLALGDTHQHRNIELPSRRDYCFQPNQIRHIEMPQCDMRLIRVFEKVS